MSYNKIAAKLVNVSKSYNVFPTKLDNLIHAMFNRGTYHTYTALNSVSLEIKKGESLGIIGPNGAGKSTLLQVISNIIKPTSGSVEIEGKITSLLELGAGFNPEFSGRENIVISSMIYGLSKDQAKNKVQDIIKFADIGDYINLPVKTYSTGMFIRLAFSVAAHVDAEILVIDEALSVGDAEFSQKCMQFMRNFRESGTLILVSHDLNAISSFCDKCIWLDNGKVLQEGDPKTITNAYINSILNRQKSDEQNISVNKGNEIFTDNVINIISFDVTDNNNVDINPNIDIKLVFKIEKDISDLLIGFHFKDKYGQIVLCDVISKNIKDLSIERNIQLDTTFTIPKLNNGKYFFSYSIAEGTEIHHSQHYWEHDVFSIDVNSNEHRYGIVKLETSNIELKNI